MYKILCLGNQWRGSDDGSIFNAFARNGHLIEILDHKFYIPSEYRSTLSKIITKLSYPILLKDYNNAIIKSLDVFKPDIICVYKGNCIEPSTLRIAQQKGIPIFCIYPDVSFFDHASNIPKLVPYYSYIFTTKSFGVKDLKDKFNFTKVSLINHCVDPNIHRPIKLSKSDYAHLENDISFIGSFSKKKEDVIDYLVKNIPDINLKIWGGAWNLSKSQFVLTKYMKTSLYGDMYAIAIQKSKINLAILSESGTKSSSGDLVTSRTFHIPGAGGFMLHEYTDELMEIYEDNISVASYKSKDELSDKINYFLKNESVREGIRQKGHEVVWKFHKSDDRAKYIADILKKENILK